MFRHRAQRFTFDSGHGTALTKIVVRLNPEATSGGPQSQFTVRIDSIETAPSGTATPTSSAPVQFIVASVPAPVGSIPPLPSPGGNQEPLPTPWQVQLSRTAPVDLPITCTIGPCERAFWLIAQLLDPGSEPVDVHWSVDGNLVYLANAWPSGAAGTINIGEPTELSGPITQLAATTPAESLTLNAQRPVAARVIQAQIGRDAIPSDGSPLGALSVDLAGSALYFAPAVAVYPLDGGDIAAQGGMPTAAPTGVDPFAGCTPGADCTRRFLVTFAWQADPYDSTRTEQQFTWHATVRRVDLIRAWTTSASLSATVDRVIDLTSTPDVVHLEGDAGASTGQSAFNIAPQVVVSIASTTSSKDALARLLPVPAVVSYRTDLLDQSATQPPGYSNGSIAITRPINGVANSSELFDPGGPEWIDNLTSSPQGACHIGEACPPLRIATQLNGPPNTVRTANFHWSLDITTYSYTDIPVTSSATQQ